MVSVELGSVLCPKNTKAITAKGQEDNDIVICFDSQRRKQMGCDYYIQIQKK